MNQGHSQKNVILSGSTVTGDLTLGNYIGAIRHWKQLQEKYDCFYFLADLHALTAKQDPRLLRERTDSFFAQYLALGLDPGRNTLFVQSQVRGHTELTWILTCLTPMGHLGRMAQFKEKSEKAKTVNAGLFTYPILMAADILLYQANLVPVGEDQKQHLELCRDIVTFFNNRYGEEALTLPEPLIGKEGARIMGLQEPHKKMSKSDDNKKNVVSIIESPKAIQKKIKSAVTDSGSHIAYDPQNQAGLANLLTIYAAFSGRDVHAICSEYQGKLYGHLKVDLAELVVETLRPVQEKYQQLMQDRQYLREQMVSGAAKAQERAEQTLKHVYEKIGLVV